MRGPNRRTGTENAIAQSMPLTPARDRPRMASSSICPVARARPAFSRGTPTGEGIPIEERSAEEVTHIAGQKITPDGVPVRHPAFDVTPHRLVTAIVCERGVARPPYTESLRAFVEAAEEERR